MPPRRKKQKTIAIGFDIVSERLNDAFFEMMAYKPPPASAQSNLRNSMIELRSSFTATKKPWSSARSARTLSPPSIRLPPTTPPSISSVTTRSSTGSLPLRNDRRRAEGIADAQLNDGPRPGSPSLRLSSQLQGLRRLAISEAIRLVINDQFTLVRRCANIVGM